MGEEDKDKKDKDKKDKDKKEKDKKDKNKKEKKDKEKKDKDKKQKEGAMVGAEWKLEVSKNLDRIILAYEKIVSTFKDVDNYILKDSDSKEQFIENVKKSIKDLPEGSQQVFLSFLNSLP